MARHGRVSLDYPPPLPRVVILPPPARRHWIASLGSEQPAALAVVGQDNPVRASLFPELRRMTRSFYVDTRSAKHDQRIGARQFSTDDQRTRSHPSQWRPCRQNQRRDQ